MPSTPAWATARKHKFFPRKWRQANRLNECTIAVSEHSKEIDKFALYIVVRFNLRWLAVYEHCCRTAKHIAEIRGTGKQEQKSIEMAVLAAVPPESNEFAYGVFFG